MKAKSTFKIIKWDETDISELPDKMKITKAEIEYEITSDIEGKSSSTIFNVIQLF